MGPTFSASLCAGSTNEMSGRVTPIANPSRWYAPQPTPRDRCGSQPPEITEIRAHERSVYTMRARYVLTFFLPWRRGGEQCLAIFLILMVADPALRPAVRRRARHPD